MSIATQMARIVAQITRLQNIKASIRSALVTQGIAASNHNMTDFADDILQIQTGSIGTDVSDTTATRDTVVSPKVFYDANGQRQTGQLVINDLTPSSSAPAIYSGRVYKPTNNGYAISTYSAWSPYTDNHLKPPGFVRLSDYAYIYAEEQAGGTPNMLLADSRGSNYPVEDTVTITKDQTAVLKYIRHAAAGGSTMTITINGESRTLSAATTHEMYTESISLEAGDVVKIYAKSASTSNVVVMVSLAYLE